MALLVRGWSWGLGTVWGPRHVVTPLRGCVLGAQEAGGKISAQPSAVNGNVPIIAALLSLPRPRTKTTHQVSTIAPALLLLWYVAGITRRGLCGAQASVVRKEIATYVVMDDYVNENEYLHLGA